MAYEVGVSSDPAIVLIQAWWGVTNEMVEHARTIEKKGYRVAIPDLYLGSTAESVLEAKHVRPGMGGRTRKGERRGGSGERTARCGAEGQSAKGEGSDGGRGERGGGMRGAAGAAGAARAGGAGGAEGAGGAGGGEGSEGTRRQPQRRRGEGGRDRGWRMLHRAAVECAHTENLLFPPPPAPHHRLPPSSSRSSSSSLVLHPLLPFCTFRPPSPPPSSFPHLSSSSPPAPPLCSSSSRS